MRASTHTPPPLASAPPFQSMPQAPEGGLRRFHLWQGQNIFLFGGKVMLGPSLGTFLFTHILVVPAVIVFIAVV